MAGFYGNAGYSTPSGSYTALSMHEVWYSKEWDNAPMPHAIFYMKDGHAIHGSYRCRRIWASRLHMAAYASRRRTPPSFMTS